MKKKLKRSQFPDFVGELSKVTCIMKLTLILILLNVCVAFSSTYSQQTKFTLSGENVSIRDVLSNVESKSEYRFFFNSELINLNQRVNYRIEEGTIFQLLDQVLLRNGIQYEVKDRTIILSPKSSNEPGVTQQQRSVSGKVTDSSGAPLPGVAIVVKNTTQGTVSDANGSYTLANVSPNAILTFSFIGMKNQEIITSEKAVIDAVMYDETVDIEEVVAIGYGTQKKENLTGSVSSISGDKLSKRAVSNPATLLQGMIPGVSVTQSSGLPGYDGASILIRGKSSYGSSTTPLILIDGVPGDMSLLNPNSLESVTVLKDAASAAVYGSRAANGVILVTTKDGSGSPDGKLSVSYNVNYGIHIPNNLVDMVSNSPDYMRWYNLYKRNQNYGDDPVYSYSEADIAAYTNPSDPVLYPSYDWVGNNIKAAPTVMQDINISGGKQTRYNLLLGYTDQKGAVEFYHAKKYTGQINITSDVTKNIRAGANIGLFYNSYGTAESYGDFSYFFGQPPTFMPFLPDGSGRYSWRAFPFEDNVWNPFALGENYLFYHKNANITSQLWLDLKILDNFHWYTKGSVNYATTNYRNFVGEDFQLYMYRDPDNSGGAYKLSNRLEESYSQTVYRNMYSYVNYEKLFNGIHHLKAMVGYNWETQYYQAFSGRRTGYQTFSTPTFNAGNSSGQTLSGSNSTWGIISGFGRINYDYKGKYLLEANTRYDGTSRIASENRWGLFPSFSAGWRFSDEPFMESLKSWLSNAKLRVSWGILGNQEIGTYPYQASLKIVNSYSFDNSSLTQGVAQKKLNNRDLLWEKTKTTDVGLDLTLFRKLSLSFDLYKKYTSDILRGAQGTMVLGLSTPTINYGAMKNTGYDLTIDYQDKIESGALNGFTYSIGLVASAYKNKTVKYGTKEDGGYYIIEEGRPWIDYYLLRAIGIFQSQEEIDNSPQQYGDNTQPGSLKFEDVTKDGIINNDDRVPMGCAEGIPDMMYGITFSAGWKNFDFYCSFSGIKGLKNYSPTAGSMKNPNLIPTQYQFEHAWTEENHSTTMVAPGNPLVTNHPSTYFLYDRSFLRLKALQLGYTLPSSLLSNFHISKLRVYFAGDNLLTFTKFVGMDPEASGFPLDKIVSFGCNVSF
ncbi:MAG: TonB-dependent receptor [Mangrovibacterium sp.]